MKIFCKAMIMSIMVAAVSLLPLARAQAQSVAEPAVVVSMAALDEQMDDIGYLAEASGFGQMAFLLKMQAEQFLKGIDTKSPMGVLMFFEEGAQEPQTLAFVPISNMDDVLNTVSQYAEIEEGDDYITILPDDGSEVLIKQVDGFAFITDREDLFEAIPSSPAKMLGDLPNSYNLSAKVFAQRIPESLRDMAMEMIEEGAADSMGEMGNFPAELQQKNFEMQMATMKSLINETEELVIGFTADKASESLRFDFQITGLDGSKLAEQSSSQMDLDKTRFGGFLMDGAAFTANACAKISEEEAAQYQDMIGQLQEEAFAELEDGDMNEKQLKIMKGVASDFFEVVGETLENGRVDMGAVVTTDDKLEFAVGMEVANPKKLENSIKDLVKMIEEEPEARDVIEFNLNAGKMNGVRLHEIIVQIPDNEEEVLDILGEEMTMLVGIGKDSVYLAGGANDAKALLEKAMTGKPGKSAGEGMTMQYNLFLAPVLKMAAGIEGEEMMEEMSEKLEESGKDRIRISAEAIKNGMKGQFEIQDGVLELIGIAAQNMGGMMGGGGGADF